MEFTNLYIDSFKLNMYNLTGKRGLYGLFPTQFNHRGMNIHDNSAVKYYFEYYTNKIKNNNRQYYRKSSQNMTK